MTNDLEKTLRLLEQATAAGDAPAEQLDPEAAHLREAWIAFGQALEAAQPPIRTSLWPPAERQGVRATLARQRLLATGLLAASLLIGIAVVWMLYGANRQQNPTAAAPQQVFVHSQAAPSPKARAKTVSAAAVPPWDDSLDEQFQQVGWQMLCVRENETFRTDAFGMVQYRMEELRQAIQADSL